VVGESRERERGMVVASEERRCTTKLIKTPFYLKVSENQVLNPNLSLYSGFSYIWIKPRSYEESSTCHVTLGSTRLSWSSMKTSTDTP
jgi:hypothetical protein